MYSLLYSEYSVEDGLLQGVVVVGFSTAAKAFNRAMELGLTEFRIERFVR